MAISLQADAILPQGYILIDGQKVLSVSTTGGLSAAFLADNTVTTGSLISGAVTQQKIAEDAITEEKIVNNSITTSKISNNTITTGKIVNGAVTAEKMSGGQTGSAPVYGCRAWVNFDGNTVNGVNECTIYQSGNVLKVIRNSTGQYTIYFDTPMSDTNFAVIGSSGTSANPSFLVTPNVYENQALRSTSTVSVVVVAGNNSVYTITPVNSTRISVVVFG